jgi:hypothetical protein
MSLDELSPNRSAVKRLWKKVEDGVLDSFFQDIEAELTERYEQLLNDKSESLIQRLWELQLEQGFNTVKGEALFYPRRSEDHCCC